MILNSERMLLRPWRDSDLDLYAALNADKDVMEYFPSVLSREESDASALRIRDHFEKHGFGWWVAELPGIVDFIGLIGIAIPRYTAHFTPCIEVGWRLAKAYWGKGYATEGARASINYGFNELGRNEIIACTVPDNLRSRHVMDKLGMVYAQGEDFDHPLTQEGDPRARHVLYRLSKDNWKKNWSTTP